MRTKTLTLDEKEYTVRELPSGFLRLHDDLASTAARADMIGYCVLDEDGRPLGRASDELIPMRHVEAIVSTIIELSGFEGNADTPD